MSKPVPVPSSVTQPYWTAAREGSLVAPRCESCGTLFFYPRMLCPSCMGDKFSWETLSGKAVVHTFTVVRQAAHPGFIDDVPYVLAIVETAEGLRMVTNVVGCDPEDVRIGMPLEVVFDEMTPEISVPKFRPSR